MDLDKLTAEQLREGNPTLYASLTKTGDVDKAPTPPTPPQPPTPSPTPGPTPTPVAESAPAWFSAGMAPVIQRIEAIEKGVAVATSATKLIEAKAAAKPIVTDAVGKSTLPATAKNVVIARFAEAAVGEGQPFADETALREAITRELGLTEQLLQPFSGRSNVRGLGPVADGSPEGGTIREAVTKDISDRWGPDQIPSKGKHVWTPEELAGGAQMVAVDTREARADDGIERSSAGASTAAIADASQAVQDRLAAAIGH